MINSSKKSQSSLARYSNEEIVVVNQMSSSPSILAKLKRGSCATATHLVIFSSVIGFLAVLGLIGYIIYVYGFNDGDWSPTCNNCNNRQILLRNRDEQLFLPNRLNDLSKTLFTKSLLTKETKELIMKKSRE
jgi:hypothetical protein